MYSLVDSFIYARAVRLVNTPDFALFERLDAQCSDEQYEALYALYMRPGDQTDALLNFAKENSLEPRDPHQTE